MSTDSVGKTTGAVAARGSEGPTDREAFVKLHSQLIGMEAKEAAVSVGKKVVFFVLAGILVFFAYLTLVFGLVALVGAIFGGVIGSELGRFAAGAGVVAVLHLIFGGVFFFLASRLPKGELFKFTRRELEKDLSWLKRNLQRRQNKS